jgi:hypothetical protein
MSFILTLLSSHLLSVLESELASNEPAIVNMIVQEMQLLVNKLEAFIAAKEPALAAVVNPVLTTAGNVAAQAVQAAGTVVEAAA